MSNNKTSFDTYYDELWEELTQNANKDAEVYLHEHPEHQLPQGSNVAHCFHEWKTYTGLFEIYEYCSKCGVKRE